MFVQTALPPTPIEPSDIFASKYSALYTIICKKKTNESPNESPQKQSQNSS